MDSILSKEIASKLVSFCLTSIALYFNKAYFTEHPSILLSLCLVFVLVIYFFKNIVAFFKKCYFRYIKLNVNLGFVIRTNGCDDYYYELIESYKNSLKRSNLEKIIIYNDLAGIEKIDTEKQAGKIISEYNDLDLLIWGEFSKTKTNNGDKYNELRLTFIFQNQDIKEGRLGKLLINEFNNTFNNSSLKWVIRESNSGPDIESISLALSVVSRYVHAILLKVQGKNQQCIDLLQTLLPLNIDKSIKDKVNFHLINCHTIFMDNIFDDLRNEALYNKTNETQVLKGIYHAQAILSIQDNNLTGLCALSYFEYLRDPFSSNYSMAINKMFQLSPNDPSASINKAFLFIQEKKYILAFNLYKKINYINFNLTDTLHHLDLEFKRLKEPAFIFAAGILCHKFGDPVLSREYLLDFINSATSANYGKMYEHALKITNNV